MNEKGSFGNPYSRTEYERDLNDGSWTCGWVCEDSIKVYISHENIRYIDSGTYIEPYPQDIFDEMSSHHFWRGGWVINAQRSKIYYDRNGGRYNSSYGSSTNPWPISVYDEMLGNNIWSGGWVVYSDGTKHYLQVFNMTEEGDGCGCGCGSSGCGSTGSSGDNCAGCGGSSGCGSSDSSDTGYNESTQGRIHEGREILGTIFSGKAQIIAEWGQGYTFGPSLASLKISVRTTDGDYQIKSSHLQGTWVDIFEASITGYIEYIHSSATHIAHIYGGHFVVPTDYHYN